MPHAEEYDGLNILSKSLQNKNKNLQTSKGGNGLRETWKGGSWSTEEKALYLEVR